MDKTKIQSITVGSTSNGEGKPYTFFDDVTTGDMRTINVTMTNGNIRYFIIESVLVFARQRKAIITVSEYLKLPEEGGVIPVTTPSIIFKDNEIVVDDTRFCSATDPTMTPIYDAAITHNDDGSLKEGYITLWTAYKTAIGDPALFGPAQNSAHATLSYYQSS